MDHEVTLDLLRHRVHAAEIEHRRCLRRIATLRLFRRAIPPEVAKRARDADAELKLARHALSDALTRSHQNAAQRSQPTQGSPRDS